jgi:hypothetical protein
VLETHGLSLGGSRQSSPSKFGHTPTGIVSRVLRSPANDLGVMGSSGYMLFYSIINGSERFVQYLH